MIVSSLDLFVLCFLFFFFKQKTAYEMRISDWSSDVCSSVLVAEQPHETERRTGQRQRHRTDADRVDVIEMRAAELDALRTQPERLAYHQVGRHRPEPRHREIAVQRQDPLDDRLDAAFHQHQRDHHVEHQPYRSEEHTSELQSLMRNSYAV